MGSRALLCFNKLYSIVCNMTQSTFCNLRNITCNTALFRFSKSKRRIYNNAALHFKDTFSFK